MPAANQQADDGVWAGWWLLLARLASGGRGDRTMAQALVGLAAKRARLRGALARSGDAGPTRAILFLPAARQCVRTGPAGPGADRPL
jgi:hypothetical protein